MLTSGLQLRIIHQLRYTEAFIMIMQIRIEVIIIKAMDSLSDVLRTNRNIYLIFLPLSP